MGIHLDLDKKRTAAGDPLAFNLPFMHHLLLVWFETICSIVCTIEDLISHIEGASTLNLEWS